MEDDVVGYYVRKKYDQIKLKKQIQKICQRIFNNLFSKNKQNRNHFINIQNDELLFDSIETFSWTYWTTTPIINWFFRLAIHV